MQVWWGVPTVVERSEIVGAEPVYVGLELADVEEHAWMKMHMGVVRHLL